jgi:hypothetical protein
MSLFKYVLGEDVRSEMQNVEQWIQLVTKDEKISKVTGTNDCTVIMR